MSELSERHKDVSASSPPAKDTGTILTIMSTLAVGLFIVVIGFAVAYFQKTALSREVQRNMVETWRDQGRHIEVSNDLILINMDDNEYLGAMIVWEDGEKEKLVVGVTHDGNNLKWTIIE
jgi:hypothetical protein